VTVPPAAPAKVVVVAPATVVVVVVVAAATVVVVAAATVVVVAAATVVVVVVVVPPDTTQVNPFGKSVALVAKVIWVFQYLSTTAPADLVHMIPTLYVPGSTKPGTKRGDAKSKPGRVRTRPSLMPVATLKKLCPLADR